MTAWTLGGVARTMGAVQGHEATLVGRAMCCFGDPGFHRSCWAVRVTHSAHLGPCPGFLRE